MLLHKLFRMSQHTAVEEDILTGCQFLVKTGTQFDQRCHRAVNGDAALIGRQNTADSLEHRGLAGTIGADQAPGLACMDLKTHILDCKKLLEHQLLLKQFDEVLFQVIYFLIGKIETDRYMIHIDHYPFFVHRNSPIKYTE